MENNLVVSPNPLSTEGQRHLPAELRPTDTLYSYLHRHVPDIDQGEWVVTIGGRQVPVEMWCHTKPKHGNLIEVRPVLQNRQTWALIAMLVLTYFTFGIAGAGGAIAASAGTAAATAVYVAGAIIINKVLAPKPPKAGSTETGGVLSIAGARNQMRPYQPISLLFGSVRITPDLASKPYSYFEGDDQYLGLVLLPGINVARVEEIYNGDGLLSQFDGVTLWYSGMSGMPEQTIPLFTDVDSVAGGSLEPNIPLARTTPPRTVRIQADIEYVLFDKTSEGKDKQNQETIRLRYRPVGSLTWQIGQTRQLFNRDMKTHRASLAVDVPEGQYEYDVTRLGLDTEGKGASAQFTFSTGSSVQADTTDYSSFGRIGVRIKATGQLSGSPDELRMVAHADPVQMWTGSQWVLAADRESGLSNPGAQMVAYIRGHYNASTGELLAGMGLSDAMIDIPAFQAFMLHCQANGYTYDFQLKDARNHREVLNSIALAGMGTLSDAGGRISVAWAGAEQPLSAVVNMATIKKGQFQVDYSLANAADGVEVNFFNRETWAMDTLRIPAPGVETILNPVQIEPEGVTDTERAAEAGRYHLAQSLYQYKDISFSTDLEHLSYRRLSKLSLSHDLTQWGYSGSLRTVTRATNSFSVLLDDTVPPPPAGDAYIGLRVPGELTYRVFKVGVFNEATRLLTINSLWPADMPFPDATTDNPPWDYKWCYDFKPSPGQEVRVVNITPENDLKGASVSVVQEGPEFWVYVKTGVYIPSPNGSLLQTRPIASNLKIAENQVVQGDTIFTELSATFDITGPYLYADVLMSNDSGEMVKVAQTDTRTVSWRIPSAGVYTITIRPYSPERIGGVAVSTIYATIGADVPPVRPDFFDVQQVSGGLRKYVWGFASDTIQSADYTGVEIRYIEGSVVSPDWSLMLPVGAEGDTTQAGYHAAPFESSIPTSGTWTFACRAVNTSNVLSTNMLVVTRTLGKNLGEQLADINNDITKAIQESFQRDEAEAQARIDAINQVVDQLQTETGDRIEALNQLTATLNQSIADQTAALLNEKLEREAAITTEAGLRQSSDESLAYQISQISAGTGMQFDFKKIWYFDTTNEGWNGTATGGYLNPASPLATSPSGLGIVGPEYRAIKTRVRRTGTPAWNALVQWRYVGSADWNSANLNQPAWDVNNIGTIDLEEIDWTSGTVDQIRLQLSGAVDAQNFFEYDYIAVGRPTPGASVALVQAETQARINGDAAEATQRNTLAVQMRGDYNGNDPAGLTSGLLYQERTARITENSAIAQDIDSLQVDLDGKASAAALDTVKLQVEEIDGEVTVIGQSVFSLEAQLDGENAGDTDWNAGDTDIYAGAKTVYTVITEGDYALSQRIDTVQTNFGDFSANVNTRIEAFSNELEAQGLLFEEVNAELDGKASSESVNLLTARVTQNESGISSLAENINAVNVELDGKAEAGAVTALQTEVSNLGGTVSANSTAITQVQASVGTKAEASVVFELTATVTSQGTTINSINSQAFLALNVNGYVGGFKIGNNGTVVDFAVLADKFAIVAPQGGQRLEYSNGSIRVYDTAGTKRTELGVFNN